MPQSSAPSAAAPPSPRAAPCSPSGNAPSPPPSPPLLSRLSSRTRRFSRRPPRRGQYRRLQTTRLNPRSSSLTWPPSLAQSVTSWASPCSRRPTSS
ncbi:hypothetical protein CFIO01_06956 [Colletotrichum fioriniae PJ7]|uniref:Uncharacterized protein n=1 Tax=Colletotrichum fioriniae PJ7 TaxID=1445577 RepID=A0A010SK48_9PEZI|nr:hypothetical protein CFIO01_06956 [Colletotrichum fioriniae PJ7]